ncbi:MAG: hypothetical protein CTY33_08380 [Methylotenera sp.]|nr:MAG: hypothetical protein CTY33_08380 [Methylotenera sp.]
MPFEYLACFRMICLKFSLRNLKCNCQPLALPIHFSVCIIGSLTNQPGTWQMIVSPVPEPETYGLFMVGLGIVAAIARRSSYIRKFEYQNL